jgi:hypothetical protein
MPRSKAVAHPDDADVDLAPQVTAEQLAALYALGYRGPSPSTQPQASAILATLHGPACAFEQKGTVWRGKVR